MRRLKFLTTKNHGTVFAEISAATYIRATPRNDVKKNVGRNLLRLEFGLSTSNSEPNCASAHGQLDFLGVAAILTLRQAGRQVPPLSRHPGLSLYVELRVHLFIC